MFRDVEGMVPKFTGEDRAYDVGKWVEMIDENRIMFPWTPLQTSVLAKKSLDGTAKSLLMAGGSCKTWEELKSVLIAEFGAKISARDVHRMLSVRKKKTDETVQQYVIEMRGIGAKARLDDALVIKYIIDGLPGETAAKVVLYDACDFDELREGLRIHERIRRGMYGIVNSSNSGGRNTTATTTTRFSKSTLCDQRRADAIAIIVVATDILVETVSTSHRERSASNVSNSGTSR